MDMWDSLAYRKSLIFPAFLLVWATLIPANAVAEGTIDLEAAVNRALQGNPSLAIAGHRKAAQQGRVTQAGLRPNPELNLEVENFLGSGIFEGFDSATATLSVGWILERGKRDGRVEAAEQTADLLDVDVRIERLELAADTAVAFLEVLKDQERLRHFGSALSVAGKAMTAVEKRVASARNPQADASRAAADLAWARLALEDVEHELLVSRRKLAAQWGGRDPDFERALGMIYQVPEPAAFDALIAELATSPMINRYLTEERVKRAELRLEELRAKPDWRIDAGFRHLGVADENALVANLRIPLATHHRNQGRIDELNAMVRETTARRTATRLAIETSLYGLHQELTHNLHRSSSIREEILPRLRSALEETERAYAVGRYGYRELRLVQTKLLDTELELLNEAFLAHRNALEIERLTGISLGTGAEGGAS
jgi:cobalt-zinc-cadmium efflux system outer membrane protein